jgi:putative PIN family toxin of toxin-antitoxin system
VRVALDANVIVAAFAARGLCSDLFLALVAQHDVVVPEPVMAEVERALSEKLRFPRRQIDQIVAYLRDTVEIAAPVARMHAAGLDDADAAIVASAAQAGAEAFVTGDQKILAARRIESMDLLSPRAMWERLSAPRA